MQLRKIERSREGRVGGVCAGVASTYECDAIMVRVFFIALTLATAGLGGVLYVVLWRNLPQAPASGDVLDVSPQKVDSSTYGRIRYVSSLAPGFMRDKKLRYVVPASLKADRYVSVAHMPPPEPPCVCGEEKSEKTDVLL